MLVADLAGGPSVQLSGRDVAAGYTLAPVGRWVVFDRDDGLFAVPLNASRAPVRLNDDGVDFAFLPGGRSLVFRAQLSTARAYELFRVSVAGAGLVKLSGELATGEVNGSVSRFLFDPSGKQLV